MGGMAMPGMLGGAGMMGLYEMLRKKEEGEKSQMLRKMLLGGLLGGGAGMLGGGMGNALMSRFGGDNQALPAQQAPATT